MVFFKIYFVLIVMGVWDCYNRCYCHIRTDFFSFLLYFSLSLSLSLSLFLSLSLSLFVLFLSRDRTEEFLFLKAVNWLFVRSGSKDWLIHIKKMLWFLARRFNPF